MYIFKRPKKTFADKYLLERLVDSSGLAQIWEASMVNSNSSDKVALKIFPEIRQVGIPIIKLEFTQVNIFDHESLLPATFLDICNNQPYFEMKFCKDESVFDKIGLLNEKEFVRCFCQIANALTYLHANDMIHRNIKPGNIFIDEQDYFCYHADLSFNASLRQLVEKFAKVKTDEFSGLTFISSTNKARTSPTCYHAPELFINEHATPAADIWALGATMFHVSTGFLPFGFEGGKAQSNGMILKDSFNLFSEKINQLIIRCLSEKIADRPTASEIVGLLANNTDRVSDVLSDTPLFYDNYFRSLAKTDQLVKKQGRSRKEKNVYKKKLAASLILIIVFSVCVIGFLNLKKEESQYIIEQVLIKPRADSLDHKIDLYQKNNLSGRRKYFIKHKVLTADSTNR